VPTAALELGIQEYRFVRRYLERCPQAPLSLQQVDPLIRELVQYRDLISHRTKELAGTGKSHLAQAIGQAAIQQGYRVLYRETHAALWYRA